MKRVLAALSLASAAGCTALYPLGDYAGPPDVDAALPIGVDAPFTDAPDDATDVSIPPGADVEASVPFCQAHPTATFCADFDEGQAVTAGWTGIDTEGTATCATTTTDFASAPAAMLSHAPLGTVAELSRLKQQFPKDSKHVRLTFDMKMKTPSLPNAAQISVAEIVCFQNDLSLFDGGWIFWSKHGGSSVLFGMYTNNGTTFSVVPPPTSDTWTSYVIDADFDNKVITMSMNDTMVASVSVNYACGHYQAAQINLGLSVEPNGEVVDTLYDNVLLEVE